MIIIFILIILKRKNNNYLKILKIYKTKNFDYNYYYKLPFPPLISSI